MNQRAAAKRAERQSNIFLKSRIFAKIQFLCFDSQQFLLVHAENVFYIPVWALGSDINNIECNKIGVT